MAAISFAATNFPMENMLAVDELMAFGEEITTTQNQRQLQRSIVQHEISDNYLDKPMVTKTFKEETNSSNSHGNIKKSQSIDASQSDESSKPQNPTVARSKTNGKDFVFGLKSAFMFEEFEITKTNKHNNKQRRILVIEGTAIYHKKQCIDAKTGNVRDP